LAEGLAFSRRVFLSLAGFAAFFAGRGAVRSALAAAAPEPESGVTVVRGWVVRRDELHLLPPP
jgi:hypothetical protein